MNLKDLYITDSINTLEALAQRDEVIHSLKKSHRFIHFAKKMMGELLTCQDDQEKCYILCRRYTHLMDHLFKISDDETYLKALYSSDYRKVKELAVVLKESLENRYKKLAVETSLEEFKIPPLSQLSNSTSIQMVPKFKDTFISPGELYKMLKTTNNFLIVDTRSRVDFEGCRINANKGYVINIPGNIMIPGLSANTLGQRLDNPAKDIWDKRDTFDAIVLLDADTTKYNYVGSKLERLRSYVVDWDTLRVYQEDPVVLNGGLKEFVEWYPTEVDNSQVFLSQTNSDIDELLDLESITYPESGSGKQMTLKIHSTSSLTNLEQRIKRDFDDELDELESFTAPSLFEDISENFYHDSTKTSTSKKINKICPTAKIDKAAVKEILEDNKATLLRQARKAAKPKIQVNDNKEERRKGRPVYKRERQKSEIESKRFRDKSPQVKPPVIDRSFKPIALTGEGFTGLRNVKNICYMNCLLQCLKVIPSIKSSYMTSDRYISFTTKKPPVINYHLATVLRELWGGTSQRPKSFLISHFKDRICEYAPMYDRGAHEDCFEFFLFLFNAVSDDCAIDIPRKMMTESEKAWYGHLQGRSSFWIDQFYFQLKNIKVCCNCRKVNPSFDTEGLLMLPVPNRSCSLQGMIGDYLQENILIDFSCSNCKSTGTIVNKKQLIVEPEILVIVLKRYMASGDNSFRKNEVEVDFPIHNLKFGSSRYSCYSVVQHSGGMTHGHYYATIQLNEKLEQWYMFNDESITRYTKPINEIGQIRNSAAGFFYVRQAL